MGPDADIFARSLRQWREAAGLSRAEVEMMLSERHGLGSGYLASLENARIKPPERDVCDTLAQRLGVDPDAVWRLAAWERLRRFDEALYQWLRNDSSGEEARLLRDENRRLRAALAAVRKAIEGV